MKAYARQCRLSGFDGLAEALGSQLHVFQQRQLVIKARRVSEVSETASQNSRVCPEVQTKHLATARSQTCEARNHAQQGCFSRAVAAANCNQFALANREICINKHGVVIDDTDC